MPFAQLRDFVRSRIGGASVSAAIGVTWFLFWPVQNSLNIVLVLLCVTLFVSRGSPYFRALSTQSSIVLGMVGVLGTLGLVTSFSYGGTPALRTAGLVLLVMALGLVIGATVKIDDILRGLLLGATLTVGQGWILAIDDENFLEPSFYGGVTGSEPYEFFSVLVGLGSALALLRLRVQSVVLLSPFFVLFYATVLYLDLIAASLSIVVMLMAWISLLILDHANSQRVSRVVGYVFLGLFVTAVALLLLRPVSLELAKLLGDRGSLEARYLIWDAVVQSLSAMGLIFGYGASYWGGGSSAGNRAQELMVDSGTDAHIHAHSAYLDFLISFGALGTLLGILLTITFIRRISTSWNVWVSWEARSAPWIFLAGLATLGLVDSAYAQNSAGWLLIGALLGAYVLNHPDGLKAHAAGRKLVRTS